MSLESKPKDVFGISGADSDESARATRAVMDAENLRRIVAAVSQIIAVPRLPAGMRVRWD
ncbi:hypothetical protein [Vineibacter terrae]|uniref:hypothetical protein n=1 Tax=Vineibacter terrae TaxID=2586908 RepID=UPI002E2EFAE6|nr:hypothetical protein [Vineibacter terrae]HEX2891550.1 hypothetical protein [Vineibacter terrae]